MLVSAPEILPALVASAHLAVNVSQKTCNGLLAVQTLV